MANKYSEELFGAIDTLIEKRLQSLNKDITILCTIEDTTNAEAKGEYIVSNSGLSFNAYSNKTDYAIGQSVWVLIPDGDYNNTKMIIGRYVSVDSVDFNYTDPLASFVDMTGNICDIGNNNITSLELGLIANNPDITQLSFGTDLVPTVNGQKLDLTGFDRIGVSADFKVSFVPVSGDYGLQFVITTDKIVTNRNGGKQYYWESFQWSVKDMSGNVYSQIYWPQTAAFAFDPDKNGNITNISCSFYQTPGSFLYIDTEDGQTKEYPYKKDGVLVSPNLFVKNLNIKLGFSSNKITGTTVLLKKAKGISDNYNSDDNDDDDNKKLMDFRFIYKKANNEYEFINNYNDFKEFQENNGGYPKVYLYKQQSDFSYIDTRAGAGWVRQYDWTEDKPEFQESFQIFRDLSTEIDQGVTRFKVGCIFKNPMPAADNIEKYFNTTHGVTLTDDEKYAIMLFLNWSYKDEQIYGELGENLEPIETEDYVAGYDENGNEIRKPSFMRVLKDAIENAQGDLDYLKLNDRASDTSWIKVNSADILRNYLILYKEYEFMNSALHPYGEDYNFLNYLIEGPIYESYGTSEADPYKNFELAKAYFNLETFYMSDPITFTDIVDTAQEATNLIQGLRLTATDDKNGIYNIYKATENANSELIKASDAHIKRNIEVNFTSVVTQNESLDDAERIYWLIPKYNTMIKEPVKGTSYGDGIYNLVYYTQNEYSLWINGEGGDKDLYFFNTDSTNTYELPVNDYIPIKATAKTVEDSGYYNWVYDQIFAGGTKAKLYAKSSEILLVKNEAQNDDELALSEWEDTVLINEPNEVEQTFLDGAIDSYYIILENKVDDESDIAGFLKKASLTYQIKGTYRKSLNNNRIYVAIYRNKKLYTASIELMFGVKGSNGTDYTLSLTPEQEQLIVAENGEPVINTFPNVWTIGETDSVLLKASVYNADDKLLPDGNTTFTFTTVFGKQYFGNTPALLPGGKPSEIIIQKTNGAQDSDCKGIIIRCQATNAGLGFDITQYFILPARDSQNLSYIDGPDTVIYDVTNTNPNYYNVAYALKDKNEEDVVFDVDKTAMQGGPAVAIKIFNDVTSSDKQYFPDIEIKEDENNKKYYLVPKATYVDNVKYEFYVSFRTKDDEHWYQPILVSVNKYANTSINSIRSHSGIVERDDGLPITEGKSIATIMSALKKADNGDALTGLIVGSLPKEGNTERSGILGYLDDNEIFGLLDGGNAFIGKNKGIKIINEENNQNNGNVVIDWNAINDTGNIKNGGKIPSTAVATIATNNRLAIVNNSNELTTASIKFDTTKTNFVLSQAGTWKELIEYSHPTFTAANAAAIKVGRDTQGHVVLGDALASSDISWGNNNRNLVFATRNNNGNGGPGFRKLVADDFDNFSGAVVNVINNNYASLDTNAVITQLTINNVTYNVSADYSMMLGGYYLRLTQA